MLPGCSWYPQSDRRLHRAGLLVYNFQPGFRMHEPRKSALPGRWNRFLERSGDGAGNTGMVVCLDRLHDDCTRAAENHMCSHSGKLAARCMLLRLSVRLCRSGLELHSLV